MVTTPFSAQPIPGKMLESLGGSNNNNSGMEDLAVAAVDLWCGRTGIMYHSQSSSRRPRPTGRMLQRLHLENRCEVSIL